MSGREDTRLVDHLYGELSEKESREYRRALEQDPALASEAEALENLEETLGLMRKLEDEDPSPHLDSLILAHARQEADKLAENEKGFVAFVRRALRSRLTAAALVGSLAAVAAVVTVSKTAMLRLDESAPPPPSVTSMPVVAAKIEAKKEATLEDVPAANEVAQQPQEQQAQARAQREDRTITPSQEGELVPEPASGDAVVEHARRSRSRPRTTAVETPRAADKKPEEPPPVATVPESAAGSFDDGIVANRGPVQADRPTFGASAGGMKDGDARGEDLKREITEAKPAKQEPAAPAQAEEAPRVAEKLRFEPPREPARDELAKTTAPAKKTAPAKTPSTDKTKEKNADELSAMDPQNAAVWARDVIRAAEAQLAQKDSVGARRILQNGLERTKGTPAYGSLALRLAQLDFAENRLAEAAYNARLAANTPDFPQRHVALDLLERAERGDQNAQAASRAKAAPKAATKKADAAEHPADVAK